jgi:2-keto-4-pentenoate hydratase
MNQERIAAAAEELLTLRTGAGKLNGLGEAHRPRTLAEGYAVQEALHRRRLECGQGPYGGFKIGCTTAVMQTYLNIPEPCAGGVLASDLHEGDAVIRDAPRLLGVECEIAVRLRADLGGAGPVSMDEARDAVGAIMAAIELVEDRYDDWRALDAPTLIADDFFQRACVIGDPLPYWEDLALPELVGKLSINGSRPLEGLGRDILGHPLEALRWLARLRRIPAGSIVMLGSVVQTQWLAPGSQVTISLGDRSRASLTLA